MLLDAELQNRLNQSSAQGKALPKGVKDAKKWEVAQQFEAMFTHEMVKSMRKTIPQSDLTESSSGREIFQGMLDEKYAGMMAQNANPRGMAMSIYRELERQEGREMPELQELKPMVVPAFAAPMSRAQVSGDLDSIVREAAQKYNLDENLIHSVIQQESAGRVNAVSPVGAKGLMQLTDGTAREMGVNNVFDPKQNIMGGSAYLRKMLDQHGGSEKLALAAYNAGPANVEKYEGIPPFAETQSYVKSVLDRKASFAQMKKGQES